MPYTEFKKQSGKRKFCLRKKTTGKVTCFISAEARKTGKRIREAIAHGWKPTGKKSKK